MSHFALLVFSRPGENLEDQLQPFHEYECTGTVDQYVVDVDITQKVIEEYGKRTKRRYKAPDGTLHSPYENRFYREWTVEEIRQHGDRNGKVTCFGSGSAGKLHFHSQDWGDGRGYRSKVHFLPEGWEEVELPARDLMTLVEFAEDEWEYPVQPVGQEVGGQSRILVDDSGSLIRVIRFTNPNAKWDYWGVGGRYSGRINGGGSALRSEMDVVAMKRDAVGRRRKWMEDVCKRSGTSWRDLGISAHLCRMAWNEYAAMDGQRPPFLTWVEEKGGDFANILAKTIKAGVWLDELPELRHDQTLDEWVEDAPYISAHAVLKDGQWYEKGTMGWFGVVHNEKDGDAWQAEVVKLVESAEPDTRLTFVDCHI